MKRLKKRLLRKLGKQLDEAVEAGAMSAAEAAEVRLMAPGMDWVMILTIMIQILQMVLEFLNSQEA